jgi:hypothetical protein
VDSRRPGNGSRTRSGAGPLSNCIDGESQRPRRCSPRTTTNAIE